MPTPDQPPRTPWTPFPAVAILAPIVDVKTNRNYADAKAGDAVAAAQLVRAVVSAAALARIGDLVGGNRPTVLSAHAYENEGINAIPEALADLVARHLRLPLDTGVVQSNVVKHTGADGIGRMARQAKFEGPVIAGTQYLLVDDFVGMGGTLANLRGHVISQGGSALAAVALTGQPRSATLALSPETLTTLRSKHGPDFEAWWLLRFGHAFDALTESEARYLARAEDADAIRDRIAAAEQAGNRRQGP